MARKKPARPAKKAKKKAKKKTASKAAARKGAKKTARKKAAKKKASKKKASKKTASKKTASKRAASAKAPARPAAKRSVAAGKKPNLDRPRRTVADIHGIPSSLDMPRAASSAKSGRAEMKDRLSKNTGSGPALTAGDVDADWESAETIGDEAPGGDNPTPDQDVVEEIGKALGGEYADDQEL